MRGEIYYNVCYVINGLNIENKNWKILFVLVFVFYVYGEDVLYLIKMDMIFVYIKIVIENCGFMVLNLIVNR